MYDVRYHWRSGMKRPDLKCKTYTEKLEEERKKIA
jgi:hypothetical protein